MKSIVRAFVRGNIYLSHQFERLFSFRTDHKAVLKQVLKDVGPNCRVADVGGGKKPAKEMLGISLDESCVYDGYDLDLSELQIAREHYSEIFVLDLTSDRPVEKLYDVVICLHTLEHVTDVKIAIRNLVQMVRPGGVLYVKLPSRYAAFATLNKILPEGLKRRLMHAVFPGKIGDGFKAYYDRASPHEIIAIGESFNLTVTDKNLVKWSSYFAFFFPVYVLWRMGTLVQNALIKDYCETFEVAFEKG